MLTSPPEFQQNPANMVPQNSHGQGNNSGHKRAELQSALNLFSHSEHDSPSTPSSPLSTPESASSSGNVSPTSTPPNSSLMSSRQSTPDSTTISGNGSPTSTPPNSSLMLSPSSTPEKSSPLSIDLVGYGSSADLDSPRRLSFSSGASSFNDEDPQEVTIHSAPSVLRQNDPSISQQNKQTLDQCNKQLAYKTTELTRLSWWSFFKKSNLKLTINALKAKQTLVHATGWSNPAQEIITQHKNSTTHQLEVALNNFRTAAKKLDIDNSTVNNKTEELKNTWSAKITSAYKQATIPTLNSVNEQFRKKGDDFGMKQALANMLHGTDVTSKPTKMNRIFDALERFFYELEIPVISPILRKIPIVKQLLTIPTLLWEYTVGLILKGFRTPDYMKVEKALKSTKPSAIDAVSKQRFNDQYTNQSPSPEPSLFDETTVRFKETLQLQTNIPDTPLSFTTTIESTDTTAQLDSFVSSASNKTNPNHAGSCFIQTLTTPNGQGEDPRLLFATVRHSALTVKDSGTVLKKLVAHSNVSEYIMGDLNQNGASPKLNYNQLRNLLLSNNTDQKKRLHSAIGGDKSGLTKSDMTIKNIKKIARRLALLNKAIDVATAAYTIQQKTNPDSQRLDLTSISLMSPISYLGIKSDERQYFNDQQLAFKLIKHMPPELKEALGLPQTIKVHRFNLAVNEGERASQQNNINQKAWKALKQTNPKQHDAKINQLEAEIDQLMTAHKQSRHWFRYIGRWNGDKAYQLAAKLAMYTHLIGGVNAANCKSGKDRTGMHLTHALDLASSMHIESCLNNNSENTNALPPTDTNHVDTTKSNRLQWLLKSGQLDVQKWNTGSPGYKLIPNTFTDIHWNNNTTTYFEKHFGITGLSPLVMNIQAKNNGS